MPSKIKASVTVDLELCKACGICVNLCPEQVFDRDENGYAVVARQGDCTGCRICEWHCPDFAIEVVVERAAAPADAAAEAEGAAVAVQAARAGSVDDGDEGEGA
jgi:2-oxoglutarate ferredoxin oxidoreductase subunit delta